MDLWNRIENSDVPLQINWEAMYHPVNVAKYLLEKSEIKVGLELTSCEVQCKFNNRRIYQGISLTSQRKNFLNRT